MKYSKQREQILNIINNSFSHPTAYMVYEQVKKNIPNISLGTVYRNLNYLCENKLIRRLAIPNDNDHFDKLDSHFHLYCIKCQNVIDLNDDLLVKFDKIIQENLDFDILSNDLAFLGICHDCKEGKEKELWN